MSPSELSAIRVECAEAMGWEFWTIASETLILEPDAKWPHLPTWQARGMIKGDGRPHAPLIDITGTPNFPEDANPALTLASKLSDDGWCWVVMNVDRDVRCTFFRGRSGVINAEQEEATAPTFALALCLAFLKCPRSKKK